MQRPKSRKPRVRTKLVNGKRCHVYRCIVEKVLHQSIIIEAKSQDDAESQAYDIAERHPEGWKEGEMQLRDCTSVEMSDGSWEFCNALAIEEARRRMFEEV
jgi:hypothetical protein